MSENFCDKLQRYHGLDRFQLQYMNADSFVLCMKTNDIEIDLENLQNEKKMFDFSNLNKQRKLILNHF